MSLPPNNIQHLTIANIYRIRYRFNINHKFILSLAIAPISPSLYIFSFSLFPAQCFSNFTFSVSPIDENSRSGADLYGHRDLKLRLLAAINRFRRCMSNFWSHTRCRRDTATLNNLLKIFIQTSPPIKVLFKKIYFILSEIYTVLLSDSNRFIKIICPFYIFTKIILNINLYVRVWKLLDSLCLSRRDYQYPTSNIYVFLVVAVVLGHPVDCVENRRFVYSSLQHPSSIVTHWGPRNYHLRKTPKSHYPPLLSMQDN